MKLLYVLAVCLLLQACGGGTAPPAEPVSTPDACAVATQRQSLRQFMEQQYYWYTQLGIPDESADSQDAYFQSMLNKPLDRYSFSESQQKFDQLYNEGVRVGYGYTIVWADDAHTSLRVRNVEPFSPVARAGLRRGDVILGIDDATPEQVMGAGFPIVTTAGVARRFRIGSASGVEREFTVLSAQFPLSPVAVTSTFDVVRNGAPVKVGYIAYHQFVIYSRTLLAQTLTDFATAGVSELILDLRYNGGGSVNVARDLASMVGGSRTAGRMFAYLRFNDKQIANNVRVGYNEAESQPIPEGLPRVIVIGSGSTASASELFINGLRPFVDVVLIGETTYGKPYGFVPRSDCGTIYNAVQFEILNADGVGGYTDGLAPACQVADDLDRQLGDPLERRTRVALDYVVTGRCSAQAPQSFVMRRTPAQVSGETTAPGMFAD